MSDDLAEIAEPWTLRIYDPGEIVSSDGRIWKFCYKMSATSTCPPELEEYSLWMPLDDHFWIETRIPQVRRKGWRKKQTEKLLRLSEIKSDLHQTIQYVPGPNGTVPYWTPTTRARMDAIGDLLPLRQKLGISAGELHEMQMKRKKRRARRYGFAGSRWEAKS